jgi:PPP family 3-phenylpropionic acid transporter
MSSPLADRLDSPVARTSQFYFMLLTIMGVSNPFLPIWLADKGLSPEQIGIVNATPYFVVIVLNQFIGRIADKAPDWRLTIVMGACAAAVPPFLLFFVHDFWGILVVWSLTILPFLATGPVIDAAAIRMARRLGADFAHIRVWGSVGHVAATLLAGFMLDIWGLVIFLPLLAAVSVIRGLVSLRLPLFRAPAPEVQQAATRRRRSPLIAMRFQEILKPWFLLPVIGVAIVHSSHMLQAGFGSLIWQEQGVPGWAIGVLWAISPGGEIVMMLTFSRFAKRFSARYLILAASIFTLLRWVAFGLEPPLWALFFLQAANMVSFGLSYLGVVNFIANWTHENIAAEAQGFFQAVRQVGTVVALVGFGWLVAHFGAGAYYGAALMGAIGAVLTTVSLVLMPLRHEQRQRPAHR